MCAAISTAIIGTGLSAYQISEGQKQKKRAQSELDKYQRVELNNAYENIPISTVGSDLMREQTSALSADMIDVARNSTPRVAMGMMPSIQANINKNNQETRAYIDNQITNRNYAVAGDNIRIQGVKEGRDNQNINALSTQIQSGRQDMWSGFLGLGKSLMYGARNIDFGAKEDAKDFLGNPILDEKGNPVRRRVGSWTTQQLNAYN